MVKASGGSKEQAYGIKGYPEGKIPNFDAHLDKAPSCFMSSDKIPRDYLSQYQKIHKLDPGPIYKVELDMSKKMFTKKNNPQYLIPRGKVPTTLESIQKKSKLIPGVGKYNPDLKPKVLGNYLQKVQIGGFTDDAFF